MHRDKIRYKNDSNMAADLLTHPDVVRVNKHIEKMQEEGPVGTRRRLLGTSVRLSRSMAPTVHKMADECIEKLHIEIPHELYVYSSPQFNAACFKPEDGQLFVMFSSSLLESFKGSELKFVIGHEFGHHVYNHHEIPIGYLMQGQQRPDPKLALDLFTWSRNAEISADRAGGYCADDLTGVARSLFKLASGLSDDLIQFDLDEFLQQVDEMQVEDAEPGQSASQQDWFSTHPFSPLRVKALKLFHESELMIKGGVDHDNLDVGVQRVMSLMEPSYIEGRTDTANVMRQLLFAGAIAVATADGEISEKEKKAFEKFFGKGELNKGLNFDRIVEVLPDRAKRACEHASISQRMQVLRDICVISQADDHAGDVERAVLDSIADQLEVPRAFVCQTLSQDCEPD